METIDKKIQEDSRELSEDIRADFTDGEYVPDSEAKAPAVSPVAEAEINKGRRLARVRRFLVDRAKRAPAWAKYLYVHKGQLFLTLVVALIITAAFVCEKFLALQEKFGENFDAPFELVRAAAWVKDDGETFSEALENYIWGSVYLFLAVYVFFYWVGRMGLFARRKKDGRHDCFGAGGVYRPGQLLRHAVSRHVCNVRGSDRHRDGPGGGGELHAGF